jgi:putative ABC transport system permease protein
MRWYRRLFRRARTERQLDAELRFHLEQQIADYVASGMTPEEARRRARLDFGGLDQVKEECRDVGAARFVETLIQDLRYGLRQLRRNPGFIAVAVITLALGIGANTAIFSVVYAVLLKSLPYPDPDQLVNLFETNPQKGIASAALTYPDFEELRRHSGVFSALAGYQAHDLVLTGAGEPADVPTMDVTPELFSVLGVKPIAGRSFLPKDNSRGAAPVVVMSENLWRSRFGANPNLIGQSINLDKRAFTVIGIMPATFRFSLRAASEDVWIPLVQDPFFSGLMTKPGVRGLRAIGRLKPGFSMKQAQAAMDAMGARLARKFPAQDSGFAIRLETEQNDIVGNAGAALLVLQGAAGLILLIACANIANLLLSRATSRAREIAVRIALGAGRARIVRQLLIESALLGLLGGIAGILLAYRGVQGLRSVLPASLPRAQGIHVDGWVLLFAFVLSAVATVIFGLAPAFFAADSSLQTSLKESAGRSGEGGGRRRLRNLLATAEIALAMVLLVAAGLLMRSFAALTAVNPGFVAQHLVTAQISLPQYQYSKPAQWTAFSNELLARIQAQPGLRDSAVSVPLPIVYGPLTLPFKIVGSPPLPHGTSRTADYMAVSPRYFHVMEIPLLRGRFFSRQDSLMAPRVAIISQALARRYFPNQDPLGKQIVFGLPPSSIGTREIVGVVGDVCADALNKDPGPMMYAPYAQAPMWGAVVVVRSSLDTSTIAAAIRHVTHQIDKDLPVTEIESLPEALHAAVAPARFRTLLLGLFGAIALVLAAVGIFGVMSYSVSRRTHEIGIRIALGAQKGDVLALVVGQGMKVALAGVGIGIAGALALTRLLSSLLYGVKPTDPLTFVAVSLILLGVALLACYIPARRATKVDPMVALRYE